MDPVKIILLLALYLSVIVSLWFFGAVTVPA